MSDYNIAVFNSYALGESFNDNTGVLYSYNTGSNYTYYSFSGNPQTTIGNDAFNSSFEENPNSQYFNELDYFIIGNSVTNIGDRAFYNCISFSSIIIPNSLQSIGNYAFYGCSSLTGIFIPDSVQSIGEAAFYNCSALSSINIPNNVTSIPNRFVRGCTNLRSLEIPSSVNYIQYGAFESSGITSFSIPNSVTQMDSFIFANVNSATSITFNSIILPIFDGNVFLNFSNFVYVPSGTDNENSNNVTKITDAGFQYPNNIVFTNPTPCFLIGSKILTDKGYIPIEDLRKGDLVKTLKNNYLPIVLIGKSHIYNSGNSDRIKDKLYVYSKILYPELTEDLIITGGHSILIDNLTEKQRNNSLKYRKYFIKTQHKDKLLTVINELAEPYPKKGTFTIYHLALENEDDDLDYGIWANGLLVESCSKRYLTDLSGMEFIE